MPAMRQRAQRAALIASLSAWPLLALPLPTHATTPVQTSLQQPMSSVTVQPTR